MKKKVYIMLAIIMILANACSNKHTQNGPHAVIDDPSVPYVYGYKEMCSDGINEFTVNSIEIAQLESQNGITNEGSGYYVILGVKTNLNETALSDPDSLYYLDTASSDTAKKQRLKLNYIKYDTVNERLILEIPLVENMNYADMCNWKADEKYTEYKAPGVYITLKVFEDDNFEKAGEHYFGRHTALNLR